MPAELGGAVHHGRDQPRHQRQSSDRAVTPGSAWLGQMAPEAPRAPGVSQRQLSTLHWGPVKQERVTLRSTVKTTGRKDSI